MYIFAFLLSKIRSMKRYTYLTLLVGLFWGISPALAANQAAVPGTDFQQVSARIITTGDTLLAAYSPAESMAAMNGFSSLYFDHYEGEGMELAISAVSPPTNQKTESLFAALIAQTGAGASQATVSDSWQQLRQQLNKDATLLQSNTATNFSQVLIQSFIILLREGFEAMLVVTALLAYLRRAGHQDKTRVIYQGVGAALLASGVTAYLLNTLFTGAGANREAMEGMTMLVAAGVLFYVSYWLFSKREADRWQSYIRGKMSQALSSGSLFALGLAAFLAVYREGAETILFYQALAANAQHFHTALILGIAAAASALFIVYWLMQQASFRIPFRQFFTATAAFLFYMAFYFTGGAILELQNAGWISVTPINWMPSLSWLGIYPSWESFGVQLGFFIPSLLALVYYTHKQMKKTPCNQIAP